MTDHCPLCLGPLAGLKGVRMDGTLVATAHGSIEVTRSEAEIMASLVRHKSGITAEQIALLIYDEDGGPLTAETVVKIHISHLRKKLPDIGLEIDTVGYGSCRYVLRQRSEPLAAERPGAKPLAPRRDANGLLT